MKIDERGNWYWNFMDAALFDENGVVAPVQTGIGNGLIHQFEAEGRLDDFRLVDLDGLEDEPAWLEYEQAAKEREAEAHGFASVEEAERWLAEYWALRKKSSKELDSGRHVWQRHEKILSLLDQKWGSNKGWRYHMCIGCLGHAA